MVPTKGGVHAVCSHIKGGVRSRRRKSQFIKVCGERRGRDWHSKPIMLYCIFPSFLCVGTSSDVLTKRPSIESPGCSYQPPNPRAPPPDLWLRLPALQPGPSLLHCRPSPRISCSFGSWDICRPGLSCVPTGCCRLASGVHHGFCTLTPSWPKTLPNPQQSPCPARWLGRLKPQSQGIHTLVNTSNYFTQRAQSFSYHNPSCNISSYWSLNCLSLVYSRIHNLKKARTSIGS